MITTKFIIGMVTVAGVCGIAACSTESPSLSDARIVGIDAMTTIDAAHTTGPIDGRSIDGTAPGNDARTAADATPSIDAVGAPDANLAVDANRPVDANLFLPDAPLWDRADLLLQPTLDSTPPLMAYDQMRNQVVRIDDIANMTWTWSGASWQQAGIAPVLQGGFTMTYDDALGAVVFVGGSTSGPGIDTYSWDGSSWSLVSAVASPPGSRLLFSLTYDKARGQLVLFGGYSTVTNTPLSDTWTFDGTTWTQAAPATSPPATYDATLVNDPVRNKVLLINGNSSIGTWAWGGSTWSQVATYGQSPPANRGVRCDFDAASNTVVLFGGYDGSANNETWQWDGSTWTLAAPVHAPGARALEAVAYDSSTQQLVMYGGASDADGWLNDTWLWDGTDWSELQGPSIPSGRFNEQLTYDIARSEVVLFGGFIAANGGFESSDTWTWDGTTWTLHDTELSPPGCYDGAIAYDETSSRVILFSGLYIGNVTWAWDGSAWTQLSPETSPSSRAYHAMAYDEARGELMMFGGYDLALSEYVNDTWIWDGSNWNLLTPDHSPSPRGDFGMAYDALHQQIVLFGGDNGNAETWTWDGVDWTMQAAADTDPPDGEVQMAYDATLQRIVLLDSTSVYEWDGSAWSQSNAATGIPDPTNYNLAYDAAIGKTMAFGGLYFPITWTLH